MSKIVTFEQAKRLKKLDFNYLVRSYYDIEGSIYNNIPSDHNTLPRYDNGRYSAPTVSEALDFIREEFESIAFDIQVYMQSCEGKCSKWYEITLHFFSESKWKDFLIPDDIKNYFESYPDAESIILTIVLEYLEKGGKNG